MPREALDAFTVSDSDTGNLPVDIKAIAGSAPPAGYIPVAVGVKSDGTLALPASIHHVSGQTVNASATLNPAGQDVSGYKELLLIVTTSATSGAPSCTPQLQTSWDSGTSWTNVSSALGALTGSGQTVTKSYSYAFNALFGLLVRVQLAVTGTGSLTFDAYLVCKP